MLVSEDGKTLYVANVKGVGALGGRRAAEKGRNSHDHLGSVSILAVPDDEQLARDTETVHANNRLAYSLAGLEPPRPEARPVPVPARTASRPSFSTSSTSSRRTAPTTRSSAT